MVGLPPDADFWFEYVIDSSAAIRPNQAHIYYMEYMLIIFAAFTRSLGGIIQHVSRTYGYSHSAQATGTASLSD